MKKAALFLPAVVLLAKDLPACSVCFGDPKSPLTLGAKAGVFFLMGVVGFVLAAILAVTIFWMRRARLVELQNAGGGSSSGPEQEHVVEPV